MRWDTDKRLLGVPAPAPAGSPVRPRLGMKRAAPVTGRRGTSLKGKLVETRRIELPTFALRTRRSPS